MISKIGHPAACHAQSRPPERAPTKMSGTAVVPIFGPSDEQNITTAELRNETLEKELANLKCRAIVAVMCKNSLRDTR